MVQHPGIVDSSWSLKVDENRKDLQGGNKSINKTGTRTKGLKSSTAGTRKPLWTWICVCVLIPVGAYCGFDHTPLFFLINKETKNVSKCKSINLKCSYRSNPTTSTSTLSAIVPQRLCHSARHRESFTKNEKIVILYFWNDVHLNAHLYRLVYESRSRLPFMMLALASAHASPV